MLGRQLVRALGRAPLSSMLAPATARRAVAPVVAHRLLSTPSSKLNANSPVRAVRVPSVCM